MIIGFGFFFVFLYPCFIFPLQFRFIFLIFLNILFFFVFGKFLVCIVCWTTVSDLSLTYHLGYRNIYKMTWQISIYSDGWYPMFWLPCLENNITVSRMPHEFRTPTTAFCTYTTTVNMAIKPIAVVEQCFVISDAMYILGVIIPEKEKGCGRYSLKVNTHIRPNMF